MCPECSKIFDDKKSVENHLHMIHVQNLRTIHKKYHQHTLKLLISFHFSSNFAKSSFTQAKDDAI